MVVKRQWKESWSGTLSGKGRVGMEVRSQTYAFVTVPMCTPWQLPAPREALHALKTLSPKHAKMVLATFSDRRPVFNRIGHLRDWFERSSHVGEV